MKIQIACCHLEVHVTLDREVSMCCWLIVSVESLLIELRIVCLRALSWSAQPERLLVVNNGPIHYEALYLQSNSLLEDVINSVQKSILSRLMEDFKKSAYILIVKD